MPGCFVANRYGANHVVNIFRRIRHPTLNIPGRSALMPGCYGVGSNGGTGTEIDGDSVPPSI